MQLLKTQYQSKTISQSKKQYPTELSYIINKALSYYPELENESIEFIYTTSKLPYFSRPSIISILRPFYKRTYIIGISKKSTELREPTLLSNLSPNAQIGAIGHELAHIIYYRKRNLFQLLFDGLRYLNKKFRAKFERMTDRIAIQHGLGKELYSWSKEVFPTKRIDGDRGEIYYSPEQLKKII